MPFERVFVSAEEVTQLKPIADAPPHTYRKLPSPIPWWSRIVLAALVPFLPILALVTVILRVAFRDQPPSVRYAWVSFLSTLLMVSGLIATATAVLIFSFVPVPAMVNSGLPDLDERHQFSTLPAPSTLSSSDASEQLKPLVVVVSPATRLWRRQEVASAEFGAGALLYADETGYLFATANHVVNLHGSSSAASPHAMIATASGVWSNATVAATAPDLDLALLWVGRHSGKAKFVQPLATPRDGAPIFVIGHPEGLKFTLSTGIVSGLREGIIQVSAAISPGNSGGPVYDDRGNLVGIVSSKFDHNIDANAENIGFAARADAFLDSSRWSFAGEGKSFLARYAMAVKAHREASPAGKQ